MKKDHKYRDAFCYFPIEVLSRELDGNILLCLKLVEEGFNCVIGRKSWVHGDMFADIPLTHERANQFWSVWFAAFEEMDYEVTRTIAAENVVVTQWTFTGTHTGSLDTLVFDLPQEPTGKTIRLRGVSVYDIEGEFIQRETMYIDLATLYVELGVTR